MVNDKKRGGTVEYKTTDHYVLIPSSHTTLDDLGQCMTPGRCVVSTDLGGKGSNCGIV